MVIIVGLLVFWMTRLKTETSMPPDEGTAKFEKHSYSEGQVGEGPVIGKV